MKCKKTQNKCRNLYPPFPLKIKTKIYTPKVKHSSFGNIRNRIKTEIKGTTDSGTQNLALSILNSFPPCPILAADPNLYPKQLSP